MVYFIFALGLIFGSFLNVVALRSLKKESIVFPPSHCPECKHRLSSLDLVPVLSYLFLRGRCRYCRTNISMQYPLGELVTAILWSLAFTEYGLHTEFYVGVIFLSLMVVITQTDIRAMEIPPIFTYPFIVIFLVIQYVITPDLFFMYLYSAVGLFALMFFIAVISKGGMGGGDIKLFGVIGAFLGFEYGLVVLVVASIFGSLYGLYMLSTSKMKSKTPIPFGPFIALSASIVYLYGPIILGWVF